MTPGVAHRTRICWQNTGDRVAAGFRLGGASGQRKPDGSSSEKPGQESVSRGQRAARGIKYCDGRKFRFKVPGVNMVCRTTIAGTFETGQSAVHIDLIEREGDKATRL
jgi:hypothetical protein